VSLVDKTKPRIAILHYAAPPTIGGVESTMAAHARLFADHGYSVKIIAGRGEPFDSRVPMEIIEDLDSKSPRVLQVDAELARGIVGDRFQAIEESLVKALSTPLETSDVLIVHNVLSLHKNLPLASALHQMVQARVVSIIAWCHDFAWIDPQYLPEMHAGYPWELLKRPWQGVKYVVVSQARKGELAKLWNGNCEIAVVPPGIDPIEFLGITEQTAQWAIDLRLFDAAPLLLLPARLTRRKNIERAIEITAALAAQGKKPKLLVTGPPGPHNPANDEYLELLRALRKTLQVENAVIFLHDYGIVTGLIMRDLFLISDALLFPSESEGFGIPLLEAGLARLPIFCTDLPPFHESAGDQAHYIASNEPPETTARRIADCLTNDSAYQLKQRVLREFSWDRIFAERIEPLVTKPWE
jgi:glycosyltransferase involved in cell wall biosynthesis